MIGEKRVALFSEETGQSVHIDDTVVLKILLTNQKVRKHVPLHAVKAEYCLDFKSMASIKYFLKLQEIKKL